MNRAFFIAVCFILLHHGSANSAMEVTVANERVADGEKSAYIIKAVFQGAKSRYTFHSPGDAETGNENYLLSLDGGKTAYYVDNSENSCHQWSNEKLVQTLTDFFLKTTKRFNVKTSGAEIKKVFEKDADDIHTLPAKHIRIEINFNASYKYLLFRDNIKINRTTNFWVTPRLQGIDAQPLIMKIGENTGNTTLDQEIKSIIDLNSWSILRGEVKQTAIDKKGKQSSVQLLQQVTSIRDITDLPDGTFTLNGCDKIDSEKMEKKFKAFLKQLLG